MAEGFKPLLAKLVDGRILSAEEAHAFFAACLRGEPTPAQVAAAVTALRIRGETVEEIAAFATAMREAARTLDHPYDAIDTCGTGGDGQRMIAGGGEGRGEAGEHALTLMQDRRGLAVHQGLGADDMAAHGLTDGLMAEADTEDWHVQRGGVDQGQANARLIRRTGSGRQ